MPAEHPAPRAQRAAEPAGVLRPGDAKFVVALAAVDPFPRQLNELVFRYGAEVAWQRVLKGSPGINLPEDVARTWQRRASRIDPDQLWSSHHAAGVGISVLGSSAYPPDLVDDIEAPLVLFNKGNPDVRTGARVAIIGTRRASTYGRDLAADWAQALSHAGVAIVSGLALGIDAAAHRGALRGPTPPIAVVGSGLDIVYPRRNEALWHEVATRGLVLSEYPLGLGATALHFPARNRIIAALADVVVVVESHEAGGSMLTVAAASRRNRTVLAVPGSVHSPASRGTNALVRDGGGMACDLDDILMAIGLSEGARRARRDSRPGPDAAGRRVLDAFGWTPAQLEVLAERAGTSLLDAADSLERLVAQGWVVTAHGWFERVASDHVHAPLAGQHERRT